MHGLKGKKSPSYSSSSIINFCHTDMIKFPLRFIFHYTTKRLPSTILTKAKKKIAKINDFPLLQQLRCVKGKETDIEESGMKK